MVDSAQIGRRGAFNSLSRDHRDHDDGNKRNNVSFNSLSRDHGLLWMPSEVKDVDELSTPSLGITSITYKQRSVSIANILSTPSLGITEPDSGIFRLSAAFCRGTSSHK